MWYISNSTELRLIVCPLVFVFLGESQLDWVHAKSGIVCMIPWIIMVRLCVIPGYELSVVLISEFGKNKGKPQQERE